MIVAPPRCLANAASRLCSAKISAPKIFANQPWRKKVPRTNREVKSHELNIVFAPFSPPRVSIKMLRSAHALLKFPCPKFSRTNLGGRRFQEQTAKEKVMNATSFLLRFRPPAFQSKRHVAPMLRQNFRAQNFREPTLEEEGSKNKPRSKKS